MSNNSNNPTVKLSKDKAALEWLRNHAKTEPELAAGLSGCLPYHSFTKVINFDRQYIVNAITTAMPDLLPSEQELAELFLQMPPRKIAKVLNVKRSVLYDRLRALRAKALRLTATKRASYVNQRSPELTPTQLELAPADLARRTLCLQFQGKTAFAYLVERDEDAVWVDESGLAFAEEVQDILHNHEEDLGFADSVLDVESY